MKKILIIVLLMVLYVSCINVQQVNAASKIYYPGEYSCKIDGVKWKLSMNGYTSFEDGYVGNFSFSTKNKEYVGYDDQIKKFGKNKYRHVTLDKYGKLIFKVYKKKIVVKQKGTILRGLDFSGTYKKIKSYPKP